MCTEITKNTGKKKSQKHRVIYTCTAIPLRQTKKETKKQAKSKKKTIKVKIRRYKPEPDKKIDINDSNINTNTSTDANSVKCIQMKMPDGSVKGISYTFRI